jgi:hypothetical protein
MGMLGGAIAVVWMASVNTNGGGFCIFMSFLNVLDESLSIKCARAAGSDVRVAREFLMRVNLQQTRA